MIWEYLGYQYSQNSVATLGVLTVRVRARCSVEVVSGASGMFSVNFRIKWLLWHVHVHFNSAGSHKTGVAVLGRAIFLVNFRRKKWLQHGSCVCAPHLPSLAAKFAGVGTKDEEQPHPGTSVGDNGGAGWFNRQPDQLSQDTHCCWLSPGNQTWIAGKTTNYYWWSSNKAVMFRIV